MKDEAAALAPFVGGQRGGVERLPFRRFDLGGGYEVWVGRNARQNDALTFRHARKHDLWMHARGVPGSHAVLRLPNRDAEPPPPLLHRAAAIAAYFSKAQGSSLVPVMVAPRKHVRKPKGAAPGAVVVEREAVVLVEPALPAETG
ncbi:MAG: NFACT RNA binding domain-containing protein [Rhodothermales bacterium]|nr:NFACT RNA binding domain-containing protein [Rhodothermales bacterium]